MTHHGNSRTKTSGFLGTRFRRKPAGRSDIDALRARNAVLEEVSAARDRALAMHPLRG